MGRRRQSKRQGGEPSEASAEKETAGIGGALLGGVSAKAAGGAPLLLRYEEYVKILRASSLDRRLEEQERIAGYAEGAAEDLARDLSLGAYGVHHLFRRYKGFI